MKLKIFTCVHGPAFNCLLTVFKKGAILNLVCNSNSSKAKYFCFKNQSLMLSLKKVNFFFHFIAFIDSFQLSVMFLSHKNRFYLKKRERVFFSFLGRFQIFFTF